MKKYVLRNEDGVMKKYRKRMKFIKKKKLVGKYLPARRIKQNESTTTNKPSPTFRVVGTSIKKSVSTSSSSDSTQEKEFDSNIDTHVDKPSALNDKIKFEQNEGPENEVTSETPTTEDLGNSEKEGNPLLDNFKNIEVEGNPVLDNFKEQNLETKVPDLRKDASYIVKTVIFKRRLGKKKFA